MRTFLEFRELIEQKFPDFRGGRQAGAQWQGQYPKGTNPGTWSGSYFTKGSQGEFAKPNVLRMLTTNPAVSDVLQRRLGQAAAARTMMTRTLPGAVVAGSLAGIDLLKQKRAQDQKNLETRRLSRIASNYGPGGSQKLVQGP